MKKYCLVLLVSCLIFSGCATTGASIQQRQNIETKEMQGNFDTVFSATMSVFQDKGYIIKHTDKSAGVIQAGSGTQTRWFAQYQHSVFATVEQFGENRVKCRITFTKNTITTGMYGSRYENTQVVYDPKLMQEVYAAIEKEVFVRENLNK